jgi:MSHA biogenesis protein MshL
MIRKIIKLCALALVVSLLFGCDKANKSFVDANRAVEKTQKEINNRKKVRDASTSVKVRKGFYKDTKPIDLDQPKWMNKRVSFNGQNVSLIFIMDHVLRGTSAIVTYSADVQTNKIISMNYTGDIRGALDNLAIQCNYAYTVEKNQIIWADFVTKTFNISFMPGSSAYTVGNSGSQSTARGQATAISTLNDSQNSTLQASLSVWSDLKESLNNLKSKDGVVSISESTTSVMVHDHPSNVRAIENYIKQLNREMSRQVELKVKLLQMELSEDYQYGIDWELVQSALNTSFSLNGDILSNISIASTGVSQLTPVQLTVGNSSGSYAIIKALSEQGKLSIVTEPTVTTLNNQIAEVRITKDTSYLEQAEVSMATEGSSSNSITPGVVTEGFTLYVLPKIEGKQIYLQISSAISTLQRIDTINNLGQTNATITPEDAGNQDIITIQVPSISEKRFNMRSSVRNGETLIIAGYKQLHDETSTSSVFDSTALGARGSGRSNVETILLITPTIIENEG